MFQIPTLKDLAERTRRAFRVHLPGSDAWIWPNNIGPTAKVLAGLVYEAFGFINYIGRQRFALTADSENLDMHGAEFGLARRPAAPARGPVVLTASAAITVLDAAVFRRADGEEYIVINGGVLAGAGTLTIDVVAARDGKVTVTESGAPLEIVSGVTGDALAEAGTPGILGGADVEDDEAFRERILFRKRYPPHGGAPSDYVMWASELAGVSRVFVERLWDGPGTVRLFVLSDDLTSDGIPDAALVERVADHVDALMPAGASVTVAAPLAHPIDIVITGLSPNTVAVRESVLAELRATFRRLSRVSGVDSEHGGMPFLASPHVFSRSWITQAIANASGEARHVLSSPPGDVVMGGGEIPTLGSVSFA